MDFSSKHGMHLVPPRTEGMKYRAFVTKVDGRFKLVAGPHTGDSHALDQEDLILTTTCTLG